VLLDIALQLWIIFVLQICADIENSMGEDIRRPLEDMQTEVRGLLHAYKKHVHFARENAEKLLDEMFDEDFASEMARIRAVALQDDFSLWTPDGVEIPPDNSDSPDSGGLVRTACECCLHSNPLRCGLLKHYAITKFQDFSTRYILGHSHLRSRTCVQCRTTSGTQYTKMTRYGAFHRYANPRISLRGR